VKHRNDPVPLPERLHNDKLDAQAVDATVDAIVEVLKEIVYANPAREVRTLRKNELRKLAINAVGAYIVRRSQQVTLATLDDLVADGESILQ
jgi:hypothetical protein